MARAIVRGTSVSYSRLMLVASICAISKPVTSILKAREPINPWLILEEGISARQKDAGLYPRPYRRHPSRPRRAFQGCGSARLFGQGVAGALPFRRLLGRAGRQVNESDGLARDNP